MSDRIVGHYRILSQLGGGGMGVVYAAEDLRLGRRVAVKFLAPDLARTPETLNRFVREARAASLASHPHVCSVLDVGQEDGQPYLVMELLEGRTLKSAIAGRALPVAMVLELGAQIAEALEAAHAQGIIHRDLKPSNVFLTRSDGVKVLDFGLAKLSAREGDAAEADDATRSGGPSGDTESGVALGTVFYMSPEQARGETLDRRTDLFSLGAVLYEMATGAPPFPGPSQAEVFEGILGKEPAAVDRGRPEAAGLGPIIAKALCKDRALRYQTAADLKVDLERARAALSAGAGQVRPAGHPGRAVRPRLGLWVALAAALAAGVWMGRSSLPRLRPPHFAQLTFRRGIVTSARFSADGHTVVYSALWDGLPPEIFSRRLESAKPTSLGLPPATLLSLSAAGDLAILLAPAGERGVVWLGTLARVPLAGGPVRPVIEDVLDADWSPDGHDLAVVRWREGEFQLEYPVGTVLLRPCPADRMRVSPAGDRIALLDESGVIIVDRTGRKSTLGLPPAHQRLAWAPDGRSILVDAGDTDAARSLWRMGLDGSQRVVCSLAGTLVVHDVSRDGRVLLHHGLEHWGVRARAPGEVEEHDASVFANAGVSGLSADGRLILLWDGSQGPPGSALLRPTLGGEAVRLGDGHAHGLSDDGKWVALESLDQGRWRLSLTPTGAGEVVALRAPGLEPLRAVWLVEQGRLGFDGAEPGRPMRSYVLEARAGRVRAVTPEGARAVPGLVGQGDFLARASDGSIALYSLDGGLVHPLGWKLPKTPFAEAVRASGDGRSVFLRTGSVPARIQKVDLKSGRATSWNSLAPRDPTGAGHIWSIYITPDGRGYAYTHGLFLQDLFLVDGLL